MLNLWDNEILQELLLYYWKMWQSFNWASMSPKMGAAKLCQWRVHYCCHHDARKPLIKHFSISFVLIFKHSHFLKFKERVLKQVLYEVSDWHRDVKKLKHTPTPLIRRPKELVWAHIFHGDCSNHAILIFLDDSYKDPCHCKNGIAIEWSYDQHRSVWISCTLKCS